MEKGGKLPVSKRTKALPRKIKLLQGRRHKTGGEKTYLGKRKGKGITLNTSGLGVKRRGPHPHPKKTKKKQFRATNQSPPKFSRGRKGENTRRGGFQGGRDSGQRAARITELSRQKRTHGAVRSRTPEQRGERKNQLRPACQHQGKDTQEKKQ